MALDKWFLIQLNQAMNWQSIESRSLLRKRTEAKVKHWILDINIFTCNSSFHWHWSIHPCRGCNIQHSYELEDHHDLQLNTGGRSALLLQLQIWKMKNKSHVFIWANCNHKISFCPILNNLNNHLNHQIWWCLYC